MREYEKALENLEEMIVVVDRNYRYRLANRAFLKSRGLTREQLVGRSVGDLLNPGLFEKVVKKKLDQAFSGKVVKYELRYDYPKLGERDLSVSYFPIEGPTGIDRVVCVLQDVTDRKKAEEELRRSEARFRSYFELGLIGMALTSPTKGIFDVNDEICRILRYSRDELLKKTWAEITHPEDLAADVQQFERVMLGEINGYSLEKRFITKDRQVIHAIMAANCHRRPDGSVDYLVGLLQDITARKQAEEEHRKLASLVENSNDFIGLASLEGEVLYVNDAGRKLVGLDGEGPLTIFDFSMDEDRSFVAEQMLPIIAAQGEWKGEMPMRHFQTGAAIPMHTNGFLIKEEGTGRPLALATISRDITALKKAEEELRRSEAHLEEAQQIGHVGSWVFNATTGECIWSKEHYRMVGCDPEIFEPSKENTKALIHPDDLPLIEETLTRAIREESDYEMDYRIMRADGVRYHRCIGRPMAKTNEDLRFTGVVVDLTERKQAEERLQKSQSELAHVLRVTTRGEMAASIAHEINQPLGAIVNNGNVCLKLIGVSGSEESKRDALQDIVRDANRASAIIARIRALTKRSTSEKTLLSVKELIDDVLALAKQTAVEAAVKITTSEPDSLRVKGDRIQLQQMLLNLMMNAIEAMSDIEKARRTMIIQVSLGELENRPAVVVAVRDNGHGFKSEDADRMFEPFFTTKPDGMGMGLGISRSIVEAHRGRLWAEPNRGSGSVFRFILPLATED